MEEYIGNAQIRGGRDYQDDYFSIMPSEELGEDAYLLLLADGMGGYTGGSTASSTVIEAFKKYFKAHLKESQNIKDLLKEALFFANEALAKKKEKMPEHSQMGTTLIALYLTPDKAYWVSVGDSPLWLIREGQSIKRINQNHSIAGLLELQLENNEITPEEAAASPNKHMLTSAITGEDLTLIDLNEIDVKKGDIFVLASDGVESISPQEVEHIIRNSKDCPTAANEVLNAVKAKQVPNQDNATIIVAKPKFEQKQVKTVAPIRAKDKNNFGLVDNVEKELRENKNSKLLKFLIVLIIILIAIIGVLGYKFITSSQPIVQQDKKKVNIVENNKTDNKEKNVTQHHKKTATKNTPLISKETNKTNSKTKQNDIKTQGIKDKNKTLEKKENNQETIKNNPTKNKSEKENIKEKKILIKKKEQKQTNDEAIKCEEKICFKYVNGESYNKIEKEMLYEKNKCYKTLVKNKNLKEYCTNFCEERKKEIFKDFPPCEQEMGNINFDCKKLNNKTHQQKINFKAFFIDFQVRTNIQADIPKCPFILLKGDR